MTLQLDSHSVAQYLADNAVFFEEHAELLSQIKLKSPIGGRTLSLQERQMEVLRDKIKTLELRLVELVRIAHENDEIVNHFQTWVRSLLLARNDVDLPHVLVDGLRNIFSVPHATLRIWGVAETFAHTWFSAPISNEAQLFINSLTTPFCGKNNHFEVINWLEDASDIQSVALLPLRLDAESEIFGLLVLGSPDDTRFSNEMATDFLVKIGATASAALACLRA